MNERDNNFARIDQNFDMSESTSTSKDPSSNVDRRRLLNILAALDSEPRFKIIQALRGSHGKTIKALASLLGLTHSAASEHARILRSVGAVNGVLVDPDDLRTVYQRLNEDLVVTDEEGRGWIDFGVLKVRLD